MCSTRLARLTSARNLLPSIEPRCWRGKRPRSSARSGLLVDRLIPFCRLTSMGRLCRRQARRTLSSDSPGRRAIQITPTYHFHVDFATPSNSTFTTFASPAAAGFTALCPTTRACVPQNGTTSTNYLDGIGDRLMFRLAYRNFGDHESVVGTYSVKSGAVAGLRWFELRNVTSGPVTVYQQSTYQPDTTWRWMGSAAMDGQGNLAIGFSASSSSRSTRSFATPGAWRPTRSTLSVRAKLIFLTARAAKPAAATVGAITVH